ncbi:hypothetical protein FOMPIDRAFT_1136340, partial [Fomitopsis schrenkii]
LEGWKPRFPDILEDILAAEAPPGEDLRCACGRARATTRCHDCVQGAFQCPDCLVQSHRLLPFHWVEESNGRCLDKRDLSELGLTLYLGHQGLPCTTLRPADRPIMYTVTHTNGVHRVRIHECGCGAVHNTVSQLLRSRLFPATLDRPESVFTFDLLRQWDLHFLTSKKSAYDFFEALYRLTDNTGTRAVKNCYRELNIAGRLWQHLTAVKRAGVHHGLSLPNRPTSLTVPCLACPWPGFNMPANWKETPSELAYIHTCELGGDGNHGLQKKTKHDNPEDVSLSEGVGYFVDREKMKTCLDQVEIEPPVSFSGWPLILRKPETCSGFKVGRAQRPGKFRNLDVSGVVAVICIRHGCFRPEAIVDLQKGERYVPTLDDRHIVSNAIS